MTVLFLILFREKKRLPLQQQKVKIVNVLWKWFFPHGHFDYISRNYPCKMNQYILKNVNSKTMKMTNFYLSKFASLWVVADTVISSHSFILVMTLTSHGLMVYYTCILHLIYRHRHSLLSQSSPIMKRDWKSNFEQLNTSFYCSIYEKWCISIPF